MNLPTLLRRRGVTLPENYPFDNLMREFFEDAMRPVSRTDFPFVPAANIAETDKEWLVTMELPGMTDAEVDVRLNGTMLVVSGERKKEKESKDKHFHRLESTYGAFERRFELPPEVRSDAEGVKANFQKGLLEIRVAKIEPKPMTKIPVKGS
jgi:HSP20 family protein